MRKLSVLVLTLALICTFCSCKPQTDTDFDIPAINNISSQSSSSSTSKEEKPSKAPSSSTPENSSSSALVGGKDSSSSSKISGSSTVPTSSEKDNTTDNNSNTITKFNTSEQFKICYAQLTEKQKAIYNALEKAVKDMEIGWINLETSVFENYGRDVNIAVTALQNDMPQYFWIPPAYYTGNSQDGETIRILFEGQDDLTYLIDKSQKAQMEKELLNRVNEIMSQVTATTPFEIELQLHDILCENLTYSKNDNDPLVYTAYGALVKGKAVCEGYSRAMQLLLAQYNIKSTLVTGTADNIGHMWNLVYLENAWYHLDATWNDLENGKVSHTYFNLTDAEISKDHGRHVTHSELSYDEIVCETPAPYNFQLPICNKTDNNYFVKKDYIYSPSGEEKIAKLLMQPFDIIEFKFSDDNFRKQFDSEEEKLLTTINDILSREKSDFRISDYAVTQTTLIIYK